MGLFGELDIQSAEDNPWLVPANTYEADLFEVSVKESKPDKNNHISKGLSLIYKISSGDHIGKTVSEWKTIPEPADPANPTPDEKKAASYIKQRLTSLGVPESRMNTVDVNDLQGLPVIVKVTVNGEYTNVSRVELRTTEGKTSEGQTFTGFSG